MRNFFVGRDDEVSPPFPLLLKQAAAGDESAFAQLWRSSHPGLLRYLSVVCGPDVAEDVASEAWLKVILNVGSFSGDEKAFRTWLAVIARNIAIDRGRFLARRKERLEPNVAEYHRATSPDTAEEAIEALSTRAALDRVATLPPAAAETVLLRVVLGMDVSQVARLVGRSPGAVRVAVHRALKTLAQSAQAGRPSTRVGRT
jgi:RNA polymerase sigma-70 factor (ECF subfamily)